MQSEYLSWNFIFAQIDVRFKFDWDIYFAAVFRKRENALLASINAS